MRARRGAALGGLALLLLGGVMAPARAQKGDRPPPGYVQLGKPDQEEGRAVLEQFRRQGIAGDYYFLNRCH